MFPSSEDHAYANGVLRGLRVDPARPVVAIGPAVAAAARRWPAAAFARLADGLMDRCGAQILFVHGPGEAEAVAEVRNAMQHPALPAYPPTRTLTQLAALLAHCGLFIGLDTGTRHIAIAMGVPTVGIFGKARPGPWTPPGDPRHVVLDYDPGCKSRCTYPHCAGLPCIREITPAEAFAAAQRQLGAAQAIRAAGSDAARAGHSSFTTHPIE
jgi:ADP-heptose:LPS heptosyltransferase